MAKKERKVIDASDINEFLNAFKDKYGEDSLVSTSGGVLKCDAISTRCMSLDIVTGIGGLPKGRITEIFGMESCGKTTLALQVIAEAQSKGGNVAYIDVEHAIDLGYCVALGVDINKWAFTQPDSGTQAMDMLERFVESGLFSVVVLDSVAALASDEELAGEIGDKTVGAVARLLSSSVKRVISKIPKDCCVIFINQLRDIIGVFGPGPKTTTPGGKALRFYSSVRLDVRRIGSLTTGSDEDKSFEANEVTVKVVKNKVAPPFKTAKFHIYFGLGVKRSADVFDYGLKYKLINKKGSFYSYGDIKLGNGLTNTIKYLDDNADVLNKLESEVKSKLVVAINNQVPTVDDVEDEAEEKDVIDIE